MIERVKTRLFREPDGWNEARWWVFVGSCLIAISAYWALENGGVPVFMPVLGAMFVVTGLPEVLPVNRRRLAGWLRLVVLLVWGGMAALSAVSFNFGWERQLGALLVGVGVVVLVTFAYQLLDSVPDQSTRSR